MALTPRQQRFCQEYLVDLNGAAAYRRAGYRAKTDTVASVEASRLLAKPSVAALISSLQAERSARTAVTADRVVNELALLAFSDIGDVLDFSGTELRLRPACDIPEAARRAVQSVKVRRAVEGRGEHAREVELIEFRFWSKSDALDKLARHTNAYPEKGAAADEVPFYEPTPG